MFMPTILSESTRNLSPSSTETNFGESIEGIPSGGGPPLTI